MSSDGESVTIPDGRYELIPSSPGNSLVLTIDRTVQFEVEQILLDGVADAGADHGTAIVSLPSTGEIVAMATVSRSSEGPVVVSTDNRAVTAMFEPGSISKPLVVAAMLEDGLVSEETTVEVTDAIEIYDQVITDEIRHEQKVLALGDVLKYSSNVGMAMLSERIDKERMHDRLAGYGIGEPTQLGFNAEQTGQLHEVDDWSGVSLASHAIGYNYAATPLQMLRAYNVLANGGVLVEPHIISRIESADQDRVEPTQPESRRVLSEETAERITRLLAGVVADGTGHLASVPGYEIAGKTGTARLAQPNGSYLDEYGEVHLLTSFAGYLPAAHPELSIIVMIEDPAGDASGGRLAAPLFSEISNFALQHFRIPPAASIELATPSVKEQ